MILRKLHLENIRSHTLSDIEFEDGFNCVVGGVGAGKSTLLYALHFALFGEPLHRSYDYLLREGRSTGKIYLEFEHASKTYKMTRALRREQDKIRQDLSEFYQDDERVAWGKAAAVQEQLRVLIGLDKKIFEEFIWIQQEKMKDLLLQAPRDRQRILDEVFGLSDFQRAWEKLLLYQRKYETERDTLGSDPDVLGFTDLKRQCSELSTVIMNLQIELETLKVDSEEAEARFRNADARLMELEVKEKRIAELGRKRSSLETRITETRASLDRASGKSADAAQEIKKIEKSLRRLNELETETLSRLASHGITPPTSAEDWKKLDEELNARLLELRRQATELNTAEKKSHINLQTLQDSNRCPLCRRALDPIYREQLSEELQRESHDRQHQISLLNRELDKLNTQYSTILEVKDEIGDSRRHVMVSRDSFEAAQRREAELKAEVEEKELLLREKLIPGLQAVEGEMASFNVEELELARKIREGLLLKYRDYKGRIQSQERSIKEKNTLLESFEIRLKNAEEKLRRREKTEKVVSLVRDLRDIYRDVTPSLRKMYIEGLRDAVQLELDALMTESGRSFYLDVDSEYTPVITEESGYVRDINFVSGGERTWVALAYRVGLGQLVTEVRTGQSLDLLILDEPTESLGSEDGSIEALATAISNLKTVSQIIIVTHSAELAEKAAAKILVEKQGGVSKVKKV